MEKEKAMALRQFRDYLGLTQEELGERIGASRAQIAQWEIARAPIPAKFESRLRDQGFSVHEEDWPIIVRIRGTKNQLRLIIGLLADPNTDSNTRETARQELLKALSL